MYCFDLTKAAYKLSTDYDSGDWVVVVNENEWYPGIIQDVSKNYTIYKHVTIFVHFIRKYNYHLKFFILVY